MNKFYRCRLFVPFAHHVDSSTQAPSFGRRPLETMVFFVCEGCNESMKKNQVDKHASRCRTCHAVTCVDCSVTFYGNDYASHLVCVSEAEKYEKTLYKAKAVTKLNPQEAWTALIEEAASRSAEAPSHIRQFVIRLNDLGNVPRNKGKFVNFVKNSMKMNNVATMEEIWKFLEKLKEVKDLEKLATAGTNKADVAQKVGAKEAGIVLVAEISAELVSTDEDAATEKAAKKARKAERKRIREINESATDADKGAIDVLADSKKSKKVKKESV